MYYKELKPPPLLSKYIQCFWMMERFYDSQKNEKETIWPDGRVELIIHYGDCYSFLNKNKKIAAANSFVIGPLTKFIDLFSLGTVRLIGVRFHPWGLFSLFGIPMLELKDEIISLADLIGVEANILEEQVYDLDPNEAVHVLERFLTNKLAQNLKDMDEFILTAALQIKQSKGLVNVNDLLKSDWRSSRQIERLFNEYIGITPKKLSVISRFNAARLEMMFSNNPDVLDVALKYGYYDYSHFSKDFKRFLGITPKEYVEWIRQIRGEINESDHVVFLHENDE